MIDHCTYPEIHGIELLWLVSNDDGNSVWENFFWIISRTASVAVEDPVIQLRLHPRDSNPSENKTEVEIMLEYQRIQEF
jgi:hypothetical protein